MRSILWILIGSGLILRGTSRLECEIGWGQFNDDNLRLRVEKVWTRICISYCFVLSTDDHGKMQKLIGGTWDEQEFYYRFGIKGCGGMFGTALKIADETACELGTIDVTENYHGHTLQTPVTMDIKCCSKQGGCSAAFSLGQRSMVRALSSILLSLVLGIIFVAPSSSASSDTGSMQSPGSSAR